MDLTKHKPEDVLPSCTGYIWKHCLTRTQIGWSECGVRFSEVTERCLCAVYFLVHHHCVLLCHLMK